VSNDAIIKRLKEEAIAAARKKRGTVIPWRPIPWQVDENRKRQIEEEDERRKARQGKPLRLIQIDRVTTIKGAPLTHIKPREGKP
jgi:hypothetical protein